MTVCSSNVNRPKAVACVQTPPPLRKNREEGRGGEGASEHSPKSSSLTTCGLNSEYQHTHSADCSVNFCFYAIDEKNLVRKW